MRLLSLSQKAYCTATAILCSLIFNQLTAAAVIQRSNSTQLKGSGQECTSSPEWLGPKLVVDDCAGTVNKFYNIEVLRHGRQQYEFLGVNAEPEFKLPTMQTPRRYTVGACTLVVVMMNVFKDGDLPDPPKGPFYDTEVTTYHDLHMAAVQVELHCVVLRRSGGYEALGVDGSIGVMIMSTESYENRMIPPGISPAPNSLFGLPNVLNLHPVDGRWSQYS